MTIGVWVNGDVRGCIVEQSWELSRLTAELITPVIESERESPGGVSIEKTFSVDMVFK